MTECYWCHREIRNESGVAVRNVNTGFLGLSERRVAFHPFCEREFLKKRRRDWLIYGVIMVLILVVPVLLFYLLWSPPG